MSDTQILIDVSVLERLIAALEALTLDPELRLYFPAEVGKLIGKTERWVIDAMNSGRLGFTRVGQSPRCSADHIRALIAAGEVLPNKFSKKLAAAKKAAARSKRPAARAA